MVPKFLAGVLITILAGFLSGSSSPAAQAQRRPFRHPPTTQHVSSINGKNYAFTVSETVLADSPAYDKSKDPPLSIAKAIALAGEETAQYYSDDEPWGPLSLDSVRLVRFRATDKWYYVITFTPLVPFTVGPHNVRESITIPVLFTGKVIKGEYRGEKSP